MSKNQQSPKSQSAVKKDEVYVRLAAVASETGLSFEEILKAKGHQDFFVYVNPASAFSFAPRGWAPMTEEAHGFLLYRCKKLREDSEFKMILGMDDPEKFKISDIHIKDEVYRKLKAATPVPNEARTHENNDQNRGAHWEQRRTEILAAALQVVNDFIPDEKSKIWIGEGRKKRINAAKLAEEIHDNRHRWPALKDEPVGTSLRNITETIQSALKNPD
jgi:hypothetical protein